MELSWKDSLSSDPKSDPLDEVDVDTLFRRNLACERIDGPDCMSSEAKDIELTQQKRATKTMTTRAVVAVETVEAVEAVEAVEHIMVGFWY